jgi:hypothetical protein
MHRRYNGAEAKVDVVTLVSPALAAEANDKCDSRRTVGCPSSTGSNGAMTSPRRRVSRKSVPQRQLLDQSA